jgi:ribosomal protein S18 acetylase RimI-like enzyme
MTDNTTLGDITLRNDLQPGDMGYIIYMHGNLYHDLCGYDRNFERYVARELDEFLEQYDPETDRIWLAERQGQIIGTMVIQGRSGQVAQLRYFLIDPQARGVGLGKRLMKEAMDFCRQKNYTHVYLLTTEELGTAGELYRRHGFRVTKRQETILWGQNVVLHCYDADLSR